MIEDENLVDSNESPETDASVYIDAIKKLKATTVSKEKYDKLMEEHREVVDSLTNGTYETVHTEEVAKPDINEVRNAVFGENLSNLEFWKNSLELRRQVLETTGEDVFMPKGHNYQPTEHDAETAEKVASVVQECIDYANGDSALFTQELQRRTIETPTIYRK